MEDDAATLGPFVGPAHRGVERRRRALAQLARRALRVFGTVSVLAFGSGCALKTNKPAETPKNDEVEYMKMEDSFEPIEVEPSQVPSPYFVRDGKPLCFAGSNNYYLMYKKAHAVTDVLDVARDMNLKVIRMWAFIDRGSLDGSVRNIREPGHQEGIYFQYWDPKANAPAYNEGEDGLQRLDFVLHEARKRGLTLTLALTNNWRDFGGMDQYLVWYGLDQHHLFYTDPRVKQAYKNWVKHLVTRVNTIDGMPYKDDPAIFAWELANEPRAINYENFDSPDGWDTDTITEWADEMSTYIKSLDPNHMVAMGDEGFLDGGGNDWAYQASFGIDNERLTALPNIDFGTYHLYPDHWGTGHRWGNDWIRAHIEVGRRVNKPMVLEEYGIHIRRKEENSGPIVHGWERREVAYKNWNNLVLHRGGQGSMFWILSGIEEPGKLYPDYDHFTVYRDDITYDLLKSYADRMETEASACRLAEGADHGPPSPFVSARPAPGTASPKPAPSKDPASPEGSEDDGEESAPDGDETDESARRGALASDIPS